MKKIILLNFLVLFALMSFPTRCMAEEKTINLHTNTSYMIDLPKRPMDLQVTNPRVLEAEVTTELFNECSQLMLTTLDEGISYVSFKQGDVVMTIKVLVDNNESLDKSVIEIDFLKTNEISKKYSNKGKNDR